MKLTVLVDNNTYIDQYYLGEPALSFLLEDTDMKLLFDTGYSHAFMENAKAMNKDLSDLTHLVFSHSHNDHTRGFKYLNDKYDLKKVKCIAHPLCFERKEYDGLDISAPYNKEKMKEICELHLTDKPYWITDKLVFLGEIPVVHDFEPRYQVGTSNGKEDYVLDDSALAYVTDEGLWIITGCSHSGICNIISYAMKVCNSNKIKGIIGGFHLFELNDRTTHTIQFLDSLDSEYYPCHCVSLKVKAEMMKYMDIEEVGVGLTLNLNN